MTDRSSSPMNLPKNPLLVNRVDEVDKVVDLQAKALAEGAPLLVLLTGPQGIGKTVLAVSLGYRLAADFPDGVLYCEARGSETRDACSADELARQLLVQLGVPWTDVPAEPGDRLQALRAAMAGKRLLFVFDDVAFAAQIEPLLGDVSRAAVIVTSRSGLKSLEINHQFDSVRLAAFDQEAALELVGAIAGDAVRDVPLSTLARVWSACDGLPLALAVTAGRLRGGDELLDDVVEQLTRNAMEALDIDGNLVVQVLFNEVYDELPQDDQRVYRLLSLLPGPHFGHAAAAAVLNASEAVTKRLLTRFVRANLLQVAGNGRYRYHFLVREHAIGKARGNDVDEERTATAGADHWYARRAVALDKSFTGRPVPHGTAEFRDTVEPVYSGDDKVALSAVEFDVEWTNLLATARRCDDHILALVVATALCSYAYQSGRCVEVIDVYHRLLDLIGAGQVTAEPVRWQIYRDLAQLHERLGEYEKLERFAALAEEIHPPGRASVIEWRAFSYEGRGLLDEAATALLEALDAVPLMGDPAHEARATALLRMHIGRVAVRRGRFDEALPALAEATRFFGTSRTDASNAARCEALLGDVAWAERNVGEAERRWAAAAQVFVGEHVWSDAVKTYGKLAGLAEESGREADAAAYRAKARQAENGRGA